jgi:hypothetical protein
VRISLPNEKASSRLNILQLLFNTVLQTVNLDSTLDAIFGLDQITTLSLIWIPLSVDKIKSALNKRGRKKRCEVLLLGQVDQEINDADILEICSCLPNLRRWSVLSPRTTITIDGAREWKRICPNLKTVNFKRGGGLSEEVKEVLQGLGVTVINDR